MRQGEDMDGGELLRDFQEALRGRGLPANATLEGLLRHERNNGKLQGAMEMYAHLRKVASDQ